MLGKPEKIGQKNDKMVQKEKILCEEIQIWDHFFSTEQAVMKIGGTDLLRPSSNEKNPKHIETNKNPVKKIPPAFLKGVNSVGSKRAKTQK